MNTDTHTPDHGEPWQITSHTGFRINTGELRHFEGGWRERAIACVNACAGYSTEALEGAGVGYFHKAIREMVDAVKIKDSALEACEPAVRACAGMADPIVEITSLRNALRLAESALASLTWTPLTERQPAEDDGNDVGDVEFSDGSDIWQAQFYDTEKATHWRRITLP